MTQGLPFVKCLSISGFPGDGDALTASGGSSPPCRATPRSASVVTSEIACTKAAQPGLFFESLCPSEPPAFLNTNFVPGD